MARPDRDACSLHLAKVVDVTGQVRLREEHVTSFEHAAT